MAALAHVPAVEPDAKDVLPVTASSKRQPGVKGRRKPAGRTARKRARG
jgi:hypothetical protein